jgi:hypothetical protein
MTPLLTLPATVSRGTYAVVYAGIRGQDGGLVWAHRATLRQVATRDDDLILIEDKSLTAEDHDEILRVVQIPPGFRWDDDCHQSLVGRAA